MSKCWSRATLFLEHPDVPLDNNAAAKLVGAEPGFAPLS
jgi:hypothetical protein